MRRVPAAIVAALVIATASLESAEPKGAAPARAELHASEAAKLPAAPPGAPHLSAASSEKPEAPAPAKSEAHISSAAQAPLAAPGSPAATGSPVPLLRRPSWLPAKPEAATPRPSILRRPAWLDARPGEARTAPHIVKADVHGVSPIRGTAPVVKPATPAPAAVPPVKGIQLPPGLVAALANEPAARDRVIIRPMGPPPIFGRRRRIAAAPEPAAASPPQPRIIEPLLPSRHFALRWPPRPRVVLEWPTLPGEIVLTWPAEAPEPAAAEQAADPFAAGGPFPAP